MNHYRVRVERTTTWIIDVEAPTELEARGMATRMSISTPYKRNEYHAYPSPMPSSVPTERERKFVPIGSACTADDFLE